MNMNMNFTNSGSLSYVTHVTCIPTKLHCGLNTKRDTFHILQSIQTSSGPTKQAAGALSLGVEWMRHKVDHLP